MSKKRQLPIVVQEADFESLKLSDKDRQKFVVMHFVASFDQVTADALGIKDSIYRDLKVLPFVRAWELDLLFCGASIKLDPTQRSLLTADDALKFKTLTIGAFKLRRHRVGEMMRMSFSVSIAGVPAELIDYWRQMSSDQHQILIQLAEEEDEREAQTVAITYGLFANPSATGGTSLVEAAGDSEGDGSQEGAGVEEGAGEGEPVELEPPPGMSAASLASWKDMHGKKPRVPKRDKAKTEEGNEAKNTEEEGVNG